MRLTGLTELEVKHNVLSLYNFTRFSLSESLMTETELKLMAAAAIKP